MSNRKTLALPVCTAGFMLAAAIVLRAYAEVLGRWGNPMALFPLLLSLGCTLWGLVTLLRLLFGRAFRATSLSLRVVVALFIVSVSTVMYSFAANAGARIIDKEVGTAIEAGLLDDCTALLADWPFGDKWSIDYGGPDFQRLPDSIRMLHPVYVTNDDVMLRRGIYDRGFPNIGICKNGFGGFAVGVRIFRTEKDTEEAWKSGNGRCRQIAPRIYHCVHET